LHCISIESNQNLPLEVNLYNLKCLNIYDLRLKKATIKLRNEIIVANILIKIGGINFELNSLINLFIKTHNRNKHVKLFATIKNISL